MASADILRADHTELPWSVMTNNPHMVRGSKPVLVADTASFVLTVMEECAANAAFIVRACNAHYQMLEALKCAEAILDIEDRGPTLQKVRAAIGAAEREAGK